MAILYAMSDIHGELELFKQTLSAVDLSAADSKLILLGDYIDGGPQSGGTLRHVYGLQRKYGRDRVIVLKGNHEADFLEWLDTYTGTPGPLDWSGWLQGDRDFRTLRTLLTPARWAWLKRYAPAMSEDALNVKAARLVLDADRALMDWLRALPCYYETERQIFVHAGVDEEAGELWKLGADESVLVGKYPASTGPFYKDVVAGHVGTAQLAGDPDYHQVFWDGGSHYYIDGTTVESGCLPVLKYDTETGRYTQIISGTETEIKR